MEIMDYVRNLEFQRKKQKPDVTELKHNKINANSTYSENVYQTALQRNQQSWKGRRFESRYGHE